MEKKGSGLAVGILSGPFSTLMVVAVLILAACAQGHCRRQSDPQQPPKPLDPRSETASPEKAPATARVFVYKYDGSLQCGMGRAISLEAMAKELTGTEVFSSAKKSDGLMHIQVCGSPTGKANVFEIPAQKLPWAETKGFKKWGFE